METWATFSIVDHRSPIYRQALALLTESWYHCRRVRGDQTQDELDQLEAEVAYLQEAKAAEPFEWKSATFEAT